MRRFELQRREDPSGVSGTGAVAEGVQFRDGTVVLRWRSRHLSTAIYDDISTVVDIHGHDGLTTVEWIDATHEPQVGPTQVPARHPEARPTGQRSGPGCGDGASTGQ